MPRFASTAALLLAACERRDVAPDPGPSVPLGRWADTSDFQIVQNDAPAWSDSTAWRLSPEPMLHIGEVGGPPEYQLASAHSPVRLADGTIVVANMATNQIRFFDARGRVSRRRRPRPARRSLTLMYGTSPVRTSFDGEP